MDGSMLSDLRKYERDLGGKGRAERGMGDGLTRGDGGNADQK